MNTQQSYFEANKQLWNQKTPVHIGSEFYDMASFEKGQHSLNSIELELLGDISGKQLLHLQCHFGQDSISMARMGAKVTGLDFSEEAIKAAKEIAEKLDISVDFICCNVLEMDQWVNTKFDIVFASYGICGWFPDLAPWAQLIADKIVSGGRFILVDFHPVIWMFDNDFNKVIYSYFNRETIKEEVNQTYTDGKLSQTMTSYSWNHSLSDIMTALRAAGLSLHQFQEVDYSPYPCFNKVVPSEKGYHIRGYEEKLPMVYAMEWMNVSI